MHQKIHAEDGYLHVGHCEYPSEITSHAGVQSEGPFSIRVYCGTIRSSQFEWGGFSGMVILIGYHTDGCTCLC